MNIKNGILAICFLFIFSNLTFATPKADFDSMLNKVRFIIEHYTVEKSYEKWEFTNKTTKEKKKFSDFTELERRIFFFMRGQKLDNDFLNLYNAWVEEAKKAEDKPTDANEASKEDVKKYMEQLQQFQKQNAVIVEKLLEEVFAKWPDKFTKEEKEYLLKSTKEFHDTNKLIERKK